MNPNILCSGGGAIGTTGPVAPSCVAVAAVFRLGAGMSGGGIIGALKNMLL